MSQKIDEFADVMFGKDGPKKNLKKNLKMLGLIMIMLFVLIVIGLGVLLS